MRKEIIRKELVLLIISVAIVLTFFICSYKIECQNDPKYCVKDEDCICITDLVSWEIRNITKNAFCLGKKK